MAGESSHNRLTQKVWNSFPSNGASAGGWYNRNHTATAKAQLEWYQMTYGEVEHELGRGGGTKGILFWRCAAEDPTIVIGTADEAATLRVLLPGLPHPHAS